MNFTRKLLAMILALSMLISMSVFALEFPDVISDDANEEAINVLSSLGIIKGYEDGQFKPDKEVTRAELTSLLMRLQNLSLTGIEVADTGYTDVASTHWAVYDIKTASSMGIIKGFGDGTFGPEASVTFEQAVKMVVAMLGYENQAIVKGGWPNGYVVQGREIGLLKKAEMTQTAPAPRKIIAQILYNALEIDLMRETASSTPEKPSYEILKNKNIMTEYMKVERIEGVVTENPYSTLTNNQSSVTDDEIKIENGSVSAKYKIGTYKDAFDLIGLDVIAYVKYDDNQIYKEIKHIMTKDEIKEVVIPAKEIVNFTTSKIDVEDPETKKIASYKVDSSKMNILYNGKYIDTTYAFNNNLVKPAIGSVTLVDSGSGYNLIKIDSYKNYVVKTVDSIENKIYVDTAISGGRSEIYAPVNDTFDYNVNITKNGSAVQLSSIKKGNIISVKETISGVQNGIINIEILVSDVKKTGKITETDGEDNFLISSTPYKISPSLNGTTIKDKIVYNASGTFYIDVFGEIAYAEFAAAETYNYGYILMTRTSSSQGELVGIVKLFDYKSKSYKSLYFADKVVIDGQNYTDHSTAVSQLLSTAASLQTRTENLNHNEGAQPIKYMLNSSGKITEINTVNKPTGDNDNLFVVSKYDNAAKYSSTNRVFSTTSGNINIDTKTIVFSVPNDRNEEKYSIKTYSYFVNSGVYDIEVVETTSSGIASTIILYESNQDEDVHYKSPMIVVSEIKDVYENEENKTKLIGYALDTGVSKEYYVESRAYLENIGVNNVNVEKGDIIRFGLNTDGEVNQNVYLYLDASEAAAGNHPDILPYSKSAIKDKDNYPVRRVSMHSNISDSYHSTDFDITASSFTNRYAFVYGTPLNTITEDSKSMLFTDLVVGEGGFNGTDTTQSVSLIIPDKTVFYVYNNALSGSNMLKVVPSSSTDDRTLNILDIKTYDTAIGDCDNVFIYAIEGSVKVVYVIK